MKVLDFGLAKAMEPAAGSSSEHLDDSPTITTPAMTQAAMILGTAAYMSPEQARGQTIDRRADVWAFGASCTRCSRVTWRLGATRSPTVWRPSWDRSRIASALPSTVP